MVSSDERREVAARLRGPFDVCECVGHTYISGTLYGMQVCARDELALRNGMRHLADLIDPTCHIVTVEDCDGDLTEVHDCCGDKHTRDAFTGRVLPYCPDCGARVVSGDAN